MLVPCLPPPLVLLSRGSLFSAPPPPPISGYLTDRPIPTNEFFTHPDSITRANNRENTPTSTYKSGSKMTKRLCCQHRSPSVGWASIVNGVEKF